MAAVQVNVRVTARDSGGGESGIDVRETNSGVPGIAARSPTIGTAIEGTLGNGAKRPSRSGASARVSHAIRHRSARGLEASVHGTRTRLVLNWLAAGRGRRGMRGSTAGRHRCGNQPAHLQQQDDERARGRGAGERASSRACTIFPRELRRTQALTRSVKPSPASGSRISGLSGILATSWLLARVAADAVRNSC